MENIDFRGIKAFFLAILKLNIRKNPISQELQNMNGFGLGKHVKLIYY